MANLTACAGKTITGKECPDRSNCQRAQEKSGYNNPPIHPEAGWFTGDMCPHYVSIIQREE